MPRVQLDLSLKQPSDLTPMQRVLWFLLAPIVLPGVLVFVGIPMCILAGLSIPVGLLQKYRVWRRERELVQRMQAAGRFLAWPIVAERLSRGEGTLLVEQANKDGRRFWWTADDVASQAPAAPPSFADIDYVLPVPTHPFVAWCLERYTSPLRGSASITIPTGISFPPGFIEAQYLKAKFPDAHIVISVLASRASYPSSGAVLQAPNRKR